MGDDRRRASDGDRRRDIDIPHDVTNEQIVVAAALVDSGVRASLLPKLQAALFVDPAHESIWRSMRTLADSRIAFSLQSVYQGCSDRVELAYLDALTKQYPEPPANVEHHVSILKWDAVRASAVRGPVTDLLETLRDPLASRDRVRALAKQVATSLDKFVDRRFMLDPVVLAKEHAGEMVRRGVWPYGISGLDMFEDGTHRMIPGMEPGKVTTITGVSGSAKSTFAAMIALAQARKRKRVLYGAWEMDPGPTLELLALMSLGWSRYDVSTGNLTSEQLEVFRKRMEAIGTYIRFFDAPFSNEFSRRYNNDDSLNELYVKVADSGADVVILDLWERMIPDGSPDSERRALFRTQTIFKETGCHGVLLCQQKLKEIENRTDKRPTRSTVFGSQAWIDISDTMIGLHRPGHWEPAKGDDVIQILILKQRFGRWPLVVEGEWDGNMCTISNCRSVDYEAIGQAGGAAEAWLGIGTGRKQFIG